MFDSLAWRRECYERYLLDDEEDELDDREEAAYSGEPLPLPDGEASFHPWPSQPRS